MVALLACLPASVEVAARAGIVEFGWALAMVLALTVVVAPMYAPYNQVLLLPAIMVLVRDLSIFATRSRALGFGYLIAGFFVSWQWIASSDFDGDLFDRFSGMGVGSWSWPFFATFALPVCVLVMILSVSRQRDLALPKSASRLE